MMRSLHNRARMLVLSRGLGVALLALLAAVASSRPSAAGEVKVAVAANFTAAAKEIGALFKKATGDEVIFSFGATGQLFTQISQEAPFEVFLAADQKRPKKAVADGYAVPDSLFTYATGKLVLFSKSKDLVQGEETLKDGKFEKIAIANPQTAPYGAAAVEVMKMLGVYDALAGKIVQGNSIAQAYQFVDTGKCRSRLCRPVAGHQQGRGLAVDRPRQTICHDRSGCGSPEKG